MQEQQLRKTLGQSDSFFPTIHEGDDPETRYRTRRRDDDQHFRIQAIPDFLASEVKDRNVGITVSDPAVRSIEWSLTRPDGGVVPPKVRTKVGDVDATTRAFPLRKKDLTMTGSYMLSCVGYNSAGALQLVAFRDFRVVAGDNGVFTAAEGQFAFFEYEVVQNTGVRVQLAFVPNPGVTCPDIGWMQAAQAVDADGESIYRHTGNVEGDARKTPLQWTIDRKDGAPSPFYGLKKKDGAVVPDPGKTKLGGVSQADPGALLKDFPTIQSSMVAKFESCAVCRSGAGAGRVFGCAMWGFTVQADSTTTLHPRTFATKPSTKFTAAATKWNEWNEGLTQKREDAPRLGTP